jgi:FMN phosphatase YigB (HAD superfamily)
MNGNRIDIVCFDLGGVIVRICRSFEEACARAGVPVRADGSAVLARTAQLDRLHALGRLTDEAWAEGSARALDGLYAAEELSRVYHAWMHGEYAGVGAVVSRIERRGVATACLSNTTDGHWRRLVHERGPEAAESPPEFPTVVRLELRHASHLFGLRKPDEAIYRAFEKATGRRGAEILFFDDLPENVRAARSLGWCAELVDPHVETAPQLARWLEQHGVLPL